MYIASTKSDTKKQHKVTWIIPGTTTNNQIDHLLSRKEVAKNDKGLNNCQDQDETFNQKAQTTEKKNMCAKLIKRIYMKIRNIQKAVADVAYRACHFTSGNEEQLRRFGGKIVRKICGGREVADEKYQSLINHKIRNILQREI